MAAAEKAIDESTTDSESDDALVAALRRWEKMEWQPGDEMIALFKKGGATTAKVLAKMCDHMQLIEAGLIDTRTELWKALDALDKICKNNPPAASSSPAAATPSSPAGDWKWLVGGDDKGLDPPRYCRSWEADNGAGCNLVFKVEPAQRRAFTKRGKKAGVVWAPYLTEHELRLRKQRTEIFRSLVEEGYSESPKWHGSAGIRYIKDGETVDYVF